MTEMHCAYVFPCAASWVVLAHCDCVIEQRYEYRENAPRISVKGIPPFSAQQIRNNRRGIRAKRRISKMVGTNKQIHIYNCVKKQKEHYIRPRPRPLPRDEGAFTRAGLFLGASSTRKASRFMLHYHQTQQHATYLEESRNECCFLSHSSNREKRDFFL